MNYIHSLVVLFIEQKDRRKCSFLPKCSCLPIASLSYARTYFYSACARKKQSSCSSCTSFANHLYCANDGKQFQKCEQSKIMNTRSSWMLRNWLDHIRFHFHVNFCKLWKPTPREWLRNKHFHCRRDIWNFRCHLQSALMFIL